MTDAGTDPVFKTSYTVSFGDCDPAGIVFYPNIFAWLDRTFHAFLRDSAGGHAAVCKALGARGIGVTETNCKFRSPLTEGDTLVVSVKHIDWDIRHFRLNYQGHVGDRLAFGAYENRAVFIPREGRLRAGDAAVLREHLMS